MKIKDEISGLMDDWHAHARRRGGALGRDGNYGFLHRIAMPSLLLLQHKDGFAPRTPSLLSICDRGTLCCPLHFGEGIAFLAPFTPAAGPCLAACRIQDVLPGKGGTAGLAGEPSRCPGVLVLPAQRCRGPALEAN